MAGKRDQTLLSHRYDIIIKTVRFAVFAGVTFGALGANVTARVVGFTIRTEVVGDLVQWTGAFLTVVRSAVHGVTVKAGSAFVALRPGRVVLAYLRRKQI